MAGFTGSFGGEDVWVLHLDKNGNITWQKAYGGKGAESARAIAPNGDIVVVGKATNDILVLRLDENGNIKWQKTYGGSSQDWALAITSTTDGDIIVAGWTHSFGGMDADIWVLKLPSDGILPNCGFCRDSNAHTVYTNVEVTISTAIIQQGRIIVKSPIFEVHDTKAEINTQIQYVTGGRD